MRDDEWLNFCAIVGQARQAIFEAGAAFVVLYFGREARRQFGPVENLLFTIVSGFLEMPPLQR